MQYSELNINNYRGIKKCHLQDLNLVNLFFGKNNCGKSSLLEAIYILSKPSEPIAPLIVNNFRMLAGSQEENIKIDFYQANPKNAINISSDGDEKRQISISMIESHSKEVTLDQLDAIGNENVGKHYGLKLSFSTSHDDNEHTSKVIINEGQTGKIIKDKNYVESIPSGFIPSTRLHGNLNEMLVDIIKNKKENDIIEALRVVEPRIKDIQLVDNSIMVDVGFATRLPINVLGDGVRKLLSIILAIHSCANGILMIDEIDNGLHFSVLKNMWKVIFATCKEYNVQLFATTHSIDVIKSLVQVINTDDVPIAAYKLLKKEDDELIALHYEAKNLSYAVEQEIEVR